jgi:hypothetical protein
MSNDAAAQIKCHQVGRSEIIFYAAFLLDSAKVLPRIFKIYSFISNRIGTDTGNVCVPPRKPHQQLLSGHFRSFSVGIKKRVWARYVSTGTA